MESFYGSVTPDANAGNTGNTLLPVKASDGAPAGAKYLMEFRDVSVKLSKATGHPYINYRLAVVEPDCFENRGFFSMFYIPLPSEDTSAEDRTKMTTNTARVMGQIDRILGDGSALEALGEVTDVDSLKEALEDIAADLDGERSVVEVRVVKASEKQIALGYTEPKNDVRQFHAVDSWEGEDA
jgi:hypothetical protein